MHIYMCPCGTTIKSRADIGGEYEIFKEDQGIIRSKEGNKPNVTKA